MNNGPFLRDLSLFRQQVVKSIVSLAAVVVDKMNSKET